MKYSILILLFIVSCKKKPNTPNNSVSVVQQTKQPKEVVFNFNPSSQGYLYINWDYKVISQLDSLYYTPTELTIKRNVLSDTIRYRFFSTQCSNCPLNNSDITITIDGVIKQNYSNDLGADYRYIVLN